MHLCSLFSNPSFGFLQHRASMVCLKPFENMFYDPFVRVNLMKPNKIVIFLRKFNRIKENNFL